MSQLQVERMDKEQAKIMAMRARADERSQQFLDARSRAIGVDVDSLKQQHEEKLLKKAAEVDEEYQRVAQEREILKLLELREQEENAIRKGDMDGLKQEWAAQRREIGARRGQEKELRALGVEPEATGVGALQRFAGEDPERAARRRLQVQQMRQWVGEQQSEAAHRQQMEREEDRRHADYTRMVNNARALLDAEDAAVRKNVLLAVQEENRQQMRENAAKRAAQRDAEDQASTSEISENMQNPMLTEDQSVGRSMLGEHRVRPDAFKGFTHAERLRFYQENEELVREKQRAKAQQAALDRAWDAEQERVRCLVEGAEAGERAAARALRAQGLEELAEQRREAARRKELEKQQRYGDIDHSQGIYSGFGRSAR
mmetsp:Transcript_29710/g.51271  ORF Transcript_29710/g.51271 Transcript_29710/m.51271 type:complete len:373 (-) Transcript_29710:1610-2728(-)